MDDDPDRPLPPCGLYRTTTRLGAVPAGRLVYFHNHGDPLPGVFLPSGWRGNRAVFSADGAPLPGLAWTATLDPLAPEGFYRVRDTFTCCPKDCQRFEVDQLLQLGYDAAAEPIVFVPEVVDDVLVIPVQGVRIDRARVGKLAPLKVPIVASASPVAGEGAGEGAGVSAPDPGR